MEGLAEAAAAVARLASAAPRAPTPSLPLERRAAGACIAVDGSHAVVLDTGAVWVVAHRVAAVSWPGPRPLEPPVSLEAATPEAAQERLGSAYAEWGLEAPRARTAEGFAEALRAIRESQAAARAASEAAPGTLLLVDGALRGLPPGPQALADRILSAAERAGAEVAGVSKRSGLASRDGAPLVPSLHRGGPSGAWSVEAEPGTYVARLHPRAQHAFRIDTPDRRTLGRLAALSDDAVYVGYPYPLALAHNAVALTAAHVREARERLAAELRRHGGAAAAAWAVDFHEVLDRNVPG